MDLPPQAFTPPPKVRSAVVHITRLGTLRAYPADAKRSCHGVWWRRAFGQRRKMLRASLKGLAPDIEGASDCCGDRRRRQRAEETLTLKAFCALARALS